MQVPGWEGLVVAWVEVVVGTGGLGGIGVGGLSGGGCEAVPGLGEDVGVVQGGVGIGVRVRARGGV